MQDVLPAGLRFITGQPGVTANGSAVTVSISQLATGRDTSFTFTTMVTDGSVSQNAAQIMAASPGDPDSTPGNGLTNGEDDTASTDLRVSGTGANGRVAAPASDPLTPALPARRRPIRVSATRPD